MIFVRDCIAMIPWVALWLDGFHGSLRWVRLAVWWEPIYISFFGIFTITRLWHVIYWEIYSSHAGF